MKGDLENFIGNPIPISRLNVRYTTSKRKYVNIQIKERVHLKGCIVFEVSSCTNCLNNSTKENLVNKQC